METAEQPVEEEKEVFELDKVKIKTKERLSARARNSKWNTTVIFLSQILCFAIDPVNTSNMSATKATPARNGTQMSGAQGGSVPENTDQKTLTTKKKS